MAVVPIVQILDRNDFRRGGSPLREPSAAVSDFSEGFQEVVQSLVDTLHHHKIAVGLAAPQIGVHLRVAAIDLKRDDGERTMIIVNPKVESAAGKKDKKKESCMSLPHYRGEVERRDRIRISYQDRWGVTQSLEANGFLARVISHEIDHMDGILYVDRVADVSSLEPVLFFR